MFEQRFAKGVLCRQCMVYVHLVVNSQGCNGGCWLLRRLSHRLQAAMKATTRLVGSYEGCHIGCRLSQRLPHCWQAAIKVVGCCEGYNRVCWLMRRLPYKLQAAMKRLSHMLKADAKVAIKVTGFYKGCHIVEKAATLLKRLYRGYVLDILHKTNPNRGSYGGPKDSATNYAKRGTYQAPMVIREIIWGKSPRATSGVRISHGDYVIEVLRLWRRYHVVKVRLHTLVMASLFIGRDASTLWLRGGAFYRAFEEKAGGLLRTQQ
ncbi:hypothetical protein Tco_1139374, partial [Tanacetum coccineum]